MREPLKMLNDRQDLFVRHYLATLDASLAAKMAGYSARTAKHRGWKLLQVGRIRAAIDEALNERRKGAALEEEYIIQGLKELFERCMQRVPVRDSKGRPTGVWRFNPMGAARALELLGRHKGMFVDNLNVNDLAGLSDDELNERISQKIASTGAARAAPTAH